MHALPDIVGYLAAIIGTICWIPQTIKAWTTKETKDLSIWANILVLLTITLWFIYGILIGSIPLILGNLISICAVGAIVIAIFRFRSQ
ncbi:SemiSWEET family sugar transporter [Cochlodiniinecator piscidefendens]|uniref:SemiSWEET family sugar transporter n=1 Tax=Cochlodiniinecator piscidefendens TaxID=2715756 RepID=UPI001408423A|nr:SemiSWEET family transporter [Cochlodiniinecator piscidefendens]